MISVVRARTDGLAELIQPLLCSVQRALVWAFLSVEDTWVVKFLVYQRICSSRSMIQQSSGAGCPLVLGLYIVE